MTNRLSHAPHLASAHAEAFAESPDWQRAYQESLARANQMYPPFQQYASVAGGMPMPGYRPRQQRVPLAYNRMQNGRQYAPAAAYSLGIYQMPVFPIAAPAQARARASAQLQNVPGRGLVENVPAGLGQYPFLQQMFAGPTAYPRPQLPRPVEVYSPVTSYRFWRTPDGSYYYNWQTRPSTQAYPVQAWPAAPGMDPYLQPLPSGNLQDMPPDVAAAAVRQRQQFEESSGMLLADIRQLRAELPFNEAARLYATPLAMMDTQMVQLLSAPPTAPVPEIMLTQLQAIADGWTEMNRALDRAARPIPAIWPVPGYAPVPRPAPVRAYANVTVAPNGRFQAQANAQAGTKRAESRLEGNP